MARILTQLDAPMWRLVRELYLQDKVVEALHEAERLGGQDSNDLFAEAEVRTRGEQFSLRPWLTVELIAEEVPDGQSVLEVVEHECADLSVRFGWDNREKTLVAILPQSVEQPWMPGRWGYFVDKEPYDKICLPHHLTLHAGELRKTVQHEFMHGITLNLSNGRAPRWLGEAMSTYAERRPIDYAWSGWRTGRQAWLDPDALNGRVETDNRIEEAHQAISAGYSQANAIAMYLAAHDGEGKMGELLRAIGDESFLANLSNELRGRTRTDAALRQVYGLSEAELFVRALDWVRSA